MDYETAYRQLKTNIENGQLCEHCTEKAKEVIADIEAEED